MVEWWQSSPSLLSLTSKDCLTETCWGMTAQTAPSSSCTFSVLCRFDRTSRRFLALPLHELPPSRLVDFLAPHLLLGSFPEGKQNSEFPIILSDIRIRLNKAPGHILGLSYFSAVDMNKWEHCLTNGIVLMIMMILCKCIHWFHLGDLCNHSIIFLVSVFQCICRVHRSRLSMNISN